MLSAKKAVYGGLVGMAFVVVCGTGWGQAKDLVTENAKTEWTRIAIPPSNPLTKVEQWHIDAAKHTIVCDGNGGHDWLRFNQEFTNFKFHVDWRFTKREGNPNYNSGVFFRNNADGSLWQQAQTTPGGGYVFGETMKDGKKVAYNEQKNMTENRIKPAGEWNSYDIRCVKETCTLAVNGKVVNTVQIGEEKGYVGLESEGFQITFKNLRVEELK